MRARVITASILAPVVLLALAAPGFWAVALLAWLVAVLGAWEIGGMTGAERGVSAAMAGLLGLSMFGPGNDPGKLAVWGFGLFVLGVFAARFGRRSWGIAAVGWVVGPMFAVVALRRMGPSGWHVPYETMALILPVWAGDIAAIFAGRRFGRRPLAPAISPKKTVEGSVASLIATVLTFVPLVFWGMRVPFGSAAAVIVALAGIALSVLGQGGDLFESWVKRRANMKDSGSLLPGHGGIMDRVDSLLFVLPTVGSCFVLVARTLA